MPEGPEIIITQQYLWTRCKGKKITGIHILSGRYTHQSIKNFDRIKFPLTIRNIDSKGKLLWFDLNDGDGRMITMFNTFGLTGGWGFDRSNTSRISFDIQDRKENATLYYDDQRNFGTIEFVFDDDERMKRIDRLAPDILRTQMDDNQLIGMIRRYVERKRKRKKDFNVVKVLMNDQSAVVSGIGNYLIAEILYDAKISPHRDLDELSRIELKRLSHSIRFVAKTAYGDNATGYMEKFPEFLVQHKEKIKKGIFPNFHPDIRLNGRFQFKVYGQQYDPHGNIVQKDNIIKGRTLYWAPSIQK